MQRILLTRYSHETVGSLSSQAGDTNFISEIFNEGFARLRKEVAHRRMAVSAIQKVLESFLKSHTF